MAQVIYAAFGPQPANPVNQTNQCSQCKPTLDVVGLDLHYDTEADARTTARSPILRAAIFQAVVPQLWARQWARFRCTNAACGTKRACGNQPTHLAIGARTAVVPPPAGVLKWQIVVGMAREIQCVDGPAQPDVEPQIPRVDVLERPLFMASLPDTPLELGELVASTSPAATKKGAKTRRAKNKSAKKSGRKS